MLTTILALALHLSPVGVQPAPSAVVPRVEQPALRLPRPSWAFAEMPHQPDLDAELEAVGVSPFEE